MDRQRRLADTKPAPNAGTLQLRVAALHRPLERSPSNGGLADPPAAAEQLHLLVEGAIVRAASQQPETAAAADRALTVALLTGGGE